jgi:hypothetical protein
MRFERNLIGTTMSQCSLFDADISAAAMLRLRRCPSGVSRTTAIELPSSIRVRHPIGRTQQ